ncbi:P-loop containing nucleoside triphosphate hydrolase protein [Mycena capillaripes]|nr:P-loop containing nucleoside triphosphate hydrolase protein [Mycena capillaripes]
MCVSDLRELLYKLGEVKNKIIDGAEAYPNSTVSSEMGMSFEFKNVSFAYPGAKSNDNALKNISLKIPAGHLVVIVGANGSGKTTLIKLLNRLYDVDLGEILVDGLPIKNYQNIGLGNPDRINDMEMILQAAESGGASEVIKKLSDGLQTELTLKGGEKQRLVAARTFMRFLSGNIRFAAADEPSSALDPKAEHQLFQRLREAREGKTLIFVTHRFGHLTKHADLDGVIAETGTHQQLMARRGEYSELYNVQAQAFEI